MKKINNCKIQFICNSYNTGNCKFSKIKEGFFSGCMFIDVDCDFGNRIICTNKKAINESLKEYNK